MLVNIQIPITYKFLIITLGTVRWLLLIKEQALEDQHKDNVDSYTHNKHPYHHLHHQLCKTFHRFSSLKKMRKKNNQDFNKYLKREHNHHNTNVEVSWKKYRSGFTLCHLRLGTTKMVANRG